MEPSTDLERIDRFIDANAFLSNFYIAEVVWDGICWPHSEAAYQAAKFLDPKIRNKFISLTPSQAKRAGKMDGLRSDWEHVKVEIMYNIVRCKFEQNPDLKQKLLNTGSAYLEEGNFHKDNIWGCCPPGNPKGKNYLGRILMELREEWQNTTVTPASEVETRRE